MIFVQGEKESNDECITLSTKSCKKLYPPNSIPFWLYTVMPRGTEMILSSPGAPIIPLAELSLPGSALIRLVFKVLRTFSNVTPSFATTYTLPPAPPNPP